MEMVKQKGNDEQAFKVMSYSKSSDLANGDSERGRQGKRWFYLCMHTCVCVRACVCVSVCVSVRMFVYV